MISKITPFLWFDNQAEEAARFYAAIFKNSKIESLGDMSVTFQLDGQRLIALNGGPLFKFNEAISLMVHCETQEEVDEFWEKLSEGGEPVKCGWLKDKFGLFWQIVPTVLNELLNDPDPERSQKVVNAMLQMKKLDIAALQEAANN